MSAKIRLECWCFALVEQIRKCELMLTKINHIWSVWSLFGEHLVTFGSDRSSSDGSLFGGILHRSSQCIFRKQFGTSKRFLKQIPGDPRSLSISTCVVARRAWIPKFFSLWSEVATLIMFWLGSGHIRVRSYHIVWKELFFIGILMWPKHLSTGSQFVSESGSDRLI